MDLDIRGRRAIVCGASKGLGRGCAEALAAEGVELFIAARGPGVISLDALVARRMGHPAAAANRVRVA